MALLQPRLNLKVSQKQILTPGLVQMVSLLALNKQELKEMIDAELLENPVLEELEEAVPLAEEIRTPEDAAPAGEEKAEEKDPFDEIDFGSYFQDYLDPGYRTPQSTEINEKPSFENFLSKPTTLTVTDRAYIINEGKIFRTGTPEELGQDPEVRRVYLGEGFTLN